MDRRFDDDVRGARVGALVHPAGQEPQRRRALRNTGELGVHRVERVPSDEDRVGGVDGRQTERRPEDRGTHGHGAFAVVACGRGRTDTDWRGRIGDPMKREAAEVGVHQPYHTATSSPRQEARSPSATDCKSFATGKLSIDAGGPKLPCDPRPDAKLSLICYTCPPRGKGLRGSPPARAPRAAGPSP